MQPGRVGYSTACTIILVSWCPILKSEFKSCCLVAFADVNDKHSWIWVDFNKKNNTIQQKIHRCEFQWQSSQRWVNAILWFLLIKINNYILLYPPMKMLLSSMMILNSFTWLLLTHICSHSLVYAWILCRCQSCVWNVSNHH